MMKKVLTIFFATAMVSGFSQKPDTVRNKKGSEYLFTIVKDADKTAVKDQDRSGTCWSFSTLSFFESELLRMGKGRHNLSEMYIVRHTYEGKVEQSVRMHGHVNMDAGGAFHDVTNVIKDHGVVPEEVYKGLNYGTESHKHGELNQLMIAMSEAIVKNKNKKLTTAWMPAIKAVLDVYLGAVPEKFTYEGKSYTPQSFAKSMGLEADNYVEISSFTHHPFYEEFVLEVPDNWSSDRVYNVKLDEMMKVIDNALDEGYTVAWGSDVSEKYISFRNGLAIVPEKDWADMSKDERDSLFIKPVKEKKITQEMRQEAYDNYETTDDHGMHITGYAKDQNGNKFYIVKNSWGTGYNDCDGYFYASAAFVKYKTMDIMIHKDAIPKNIKKKLKL